LVGACLAPYATAQTPTIVAEDIKVLSPFVVEETTDIGYSASQSALGSRLKQPIKDIPAQIEVITPELMTDFNITSVADSFRYSINVENGEEFISPIDGGEREAWSGKTQGRIRGIFPSKFSTSRNLFSSITKGDTYNTQRISIGSGAQSMLFSLGEPAGVADVTIATAQMRNFGRVKFTGDSEEGYRMEFDVNRVLWKKKLALRFASVDEDAPSFVKPSYNRNRRYYGTLTFTPFSQTSIRVHAEKTDYKANNPVTHFPWDWATPAYEAIRQNNLSLAPLTAENTLQPQYYTGDYQGPLKLYIDRSRQTVAGPGTVPFWPAKYGPALDPNTGINRITFSPENIHLFPVVAGNIGKNFIGDNTRIRIGSSIYNVFLEQQLGGGLSLEVGAHQEKWDRKVKSIIGVWRSGYIVDVNRYIPTNPNQISLTPPTATTPGFIPNPNFGKLFAQGPIEGTWNKEKTEEYRASLAWQPRTPPSLGWLGKHSFLANLSGRKSQEIGNGLQYNIQNDTIAFQNNFSGRTGAQRVLQFRHYFDNGANSTVQRPWPEVEFDDIFSGFSFTDPNTGQVLQMSGFGQPFSASGLSGKRTGLDSAILAWQGRWLRDRLLLSYGYRRDDAWLDPIDTSATGPNRDAFGTFKWIDDVVFDNARRVSAVVPSRTYGVVGRPLDWLSLAYYASATVNLPSGWYTPFGDVIPGTNGNSYDYSVRLDSRDGKSFIKFNYYKVLQQGNNVGEGVVRINALALEKAYRTAVNENDPPNTVADRETYNTLIAQQQPNPYAVDGFNGQNDGAYPVMGDNVSKGYEVTAGTDIKGWNFRLTLAKGESLRTSFSEDWEQWIKGRVEYYKQFRNSKGQDWSTITYAGPSPQSYNIRLPDGTFRTMTMKEFYEAVTLPALASARQKNNSPVDTERTYRANLNVAYQIRQGWLKGVRTGGAVRWRSAPIVGFPVVDSGFTSGGFPTPRLDLKNPYRGDDMFDADLFAAYLGKRFLGREGLNYRLQFNVRNVLTGENSFRTGRVDAFGQSRFTVIDTPRSYALSLELEF
jgi:hypothetical protein